MNRGGHTALLSGAGYFLGEAFKSIYRNFWVSIASVGVVMITLLMLGALVVLNRNIDFITETVKQQVEIVLYIGDEASLEERQELRRQLVGNTALAEVRFVSREEALARLKEQFAEQGEFLSGYDTADTNPLRDSYEVHTVIPETVPKVAREFESYPAVGEVFYGQGYVETLFTTARAIQMTGFILMAALGVTAIFLISHSIRLAVLLRRREIMIMKYVGATNWFIRWPFVIEGLILGVFGSLLPLAALYHVYGHALAWVGANLPFVNPVPAPVLMFELVQHLLPLGVGLGVLGSAFSMSRFLRV